MFCRSELLFVTLLALDRSFIIHVMTWNTEAVSSLFPPPFNLATFSLVTMETFAAVIILVFPVLERQLYHPRFQIDDIRTGTFEGVGKNCRINSKVG